MRLLPSKNSDSNSKAISSLSLSLSLLFSSASILLSTLSSAHRKQERHGLTQQQNPFHQNQIDTGPTRFDAYNRLQAAAFAFGENLPIPEIVAFGKTSLLEALLGFRLNVREVEMGTRRPLILQMVHDPTALDSWCRFQVLSYLLYWVSTLSEQPEVVAKMASGVGVQPLYPISISPSRLPSSAKSAMLLLSPGFYRWGFSRGTLDVQGLGSKDAIKKAIKNKVAEAVVPAIDVMFHALSGLTLELCHWIGKEPVKSILFEKMLDTMDGIYYIFSCSLNYSRKVAKGPKVRMNLIDENLARGIDFVRPSDILRYDLVLGAHKFRCYNFAGLSGKMEFFSWTSQYVIRHQQLFSFMHSRLQEELGWIVITQFLLVDLRCHGDSAAIKKWGPHTVASAALDILKLVPNSCHQLLQICFDLFSPCSGLAGSKRKHALKSLHPICLEHGGSSCKATGTTCQNGTPGKVRAGGDKEDHPFKLISFLRTLPKQREYIKFKQVPGFLLLDFCSYASLYQWWQLVGDELRVCSWFGCPMACSLQELHLMSISFWEWWLALRG
ncbi:hypothetical protein RHMOL_Rhmol02G0103700 [Rhododendron molle]|uniref:Uncharacterized protein n=1 Tax=Rhododendron molle TaxID=49168 RepID=A0ACC0PNC2_RHOML|nr:hypothetical protein RHMOL_Rhmol02G0103700 [Rhododendron molle]